MTTSITTKNFASKVSTWSKAAGSLRQSAQDILDFGFSQFVEHGDAGYLSRMVVAAMETKGVNAAQMRRYVSHHTNLVWNEEGKLFRKAKKGEAAHVEPVRGSWWEFEKAKGTTTKPFDVNGRLTKLVDAMEEAIELKISPKEARELIAKLTKLVEQAETDAALVAELRMAA